MYVMLSWNLLNTDAIPAGFWIKNPDNILVGNRVAGSEGMGFWIDLPDHPLGV